MLHEVVRSSSLHSIGYDAASHWLEVRFRNGSIYRYTDVPQDVWLRFRAATSKGRFFMDHVRDHFATTRMA